MKRYDVINHLIEKYGYEKYLEIGVDQPKNCFDLIKAKYKIGVDPKSWATFKGTSDEFFSQNKDTFDIVFIDGLHIESQVLKDVLNSLLILNDNGRIVMHDIDPKTEEAQNEIRTVTQWNGSTWKAWARFRATAKKLNLCCIDSDFGVGIIRTGNQKLYTGPYTTFQDFINNREEILNIVKIEDL